MRYLLPVIFFLLAGLNLEGQTTSEPLEGTVSYVTSQNVYVKFSSTSDIATGDTLFRQKGNTLIPVLLVRDLSSISCVCSFIGSPTVAVADKVWHRKIRKLQATVVPPLPPVVPPPVTQSTDSLVQAYGETDTVIDQKTEELKSRQRIHGYFAISSYSNFSDYSETNSQKMKYTFSLLARNIGNTNLSAECYVSFVHNDKQWSEIKNNIFNGLKIYNLALNYDFGTRASLLLGRKINPKLSNMGPNDGLQFELKFKPVSVGIIAGFRPDYEDFGFNADLFQFGGYLYNEYAGKNGRMQSTLAFVQQTNSWKTDRRFVYLQHVNSLVKNLTFFGSVEMDLYRLVLNTQDSTYTANSSPKLSNLYLSLSYRLKRKLYMSFSYSARKNVIYYETYKSFLDRLLDPDTWQGYMLQVNYTPVQKLSIGVTGSYRYMPQDPRRSKNLYGYVTYSQIPGIGISATVSVTLLSTSYIQGNIYSAGISRDFVKGKLNAGLAYRYVDYKYYTEGSLPQNIGEASLTWRIYKRIAFSVYYEGTFEKEHQYNRIYGQLNLGF